MGGGAPSAWRKSDSPDCCGCGAGCGGVGAGGSGFVSASCGFGGGACGFAFAGSGFGSGACGFGAAAWGLGAGGGGFGSGGGFGFRRRLCLGKLRLRLVFRLCRGLCHRGRRLFGRRLRRFLLRRFRLRLRCRLWFWIRFWLCFRLRLGFGFFFRQRALLFRRGRRFLRRLLVFLWLGLFLRLGLFFWLRRRLGHEFDRDFLRELDLRGGRGLEEVEPRQDAEMQRRDSRPGASANDYSGGPLEGWESVRRRSAPADRRATPAHADEGCQRPWSELRKSLKATLKSARPLSSPMEQVIAS